MSNIRDFNWSVVFAWVVLTVIGLTAIYSATQGPVSEFLPEYIQANFYKQLGFVIISILIMIGVQFISPRTFLQLSFLFYFVGIVLMILTLLFGAEINGARSWFSIGPFGIQSSEFMKIATILGSELFNQ